MFVLLCVCSGLYFLLGDYDEAIMLFVFVAFIICITIYQERRTENALSSLASLAPSQATVIRGGQERRVDSKTLVPGDVVCVQEGDCMPADVTLAWTNGLQVDEALLTGESAPVVKSPAPDPETMSVQSPGHGHAKYSCFSGTMVVSGKAVGIVKATGTLTQIGVIGKSLGSLTEERSPLDKEVHELVFKMALVAAVACVVVFLGFGLTRGEWLKATLSGLSLAMGLLPEEFPVVLSVFVTIGSLRMSWRKVLVRRNKAVEALSSCSVVCTDKTGTLTTSGMVVGTFVNRNGEAVDVLNARSVPDDFSEVAEWATLAGQHPRDPMHAALMEMFRNGAISPSRLHGDRDHWVLAKEYPFCREQRTATCVWDNPANTRHLEVAVKGSPEIIIASCHLSPAAAAQLTAAVTSLSDMGLRVIAVARGIYPRVTPLPDRQSLFDRSFVGLVAFLNPLRPGARDVVQKLQRAGIRVIMVTGDTPGTAQCIAQSAGISALGRRDTAVLGDELDNMDAAILKSKVATAEVFCRVLPHQKLSIVQALKERGEVVCMIGDGVNDAPALKAAHVGVAMGQRGTQVAREAAAIVLLDDELGSLEAAVRMGRRIRDNLVKAMAYIIAVHVPLCGMVLFPVLFGWPTVFWPAHIVIMELIIDPTCSIVLEAEPEEDDVMERPPNSPSSRMVSLRSLCISLAQGSVILVLALLLHHVSLAHFGFCLGRANSMAFGMTVVACVGLVLVNRSWTKSCFSSLHKRNVPMWIMASAVALFLFVVQHSRGINRVMHFAPLSFAATAVYISVGMLSVAWFEVFKIYKGPTLLRDKPAASREAAQHEWDTVQMSMLEEGRRIARREV